MIALQKDSFSEILENSNSYNSSNTYSRLLFNRSMFPQSLWIRLRFRNASQANICDYCLNKIFTCRMPFLASNQQSQSNRGSKVEVLTSLSVVRIQRR